MNGQAELLNFIYQNSQMGIETISQLLDICEDDAFDQQLQAQLDEYTAINQEAKKLLNKNGCDEKGLNSLEKIRTYLMISMQTLTDNSPSHLSEMMMIGSNMGIINAIKKLKEYPHAEEEIRLLMERLLRFEENNVQRLKNYL